MSDKIKVSVKLIANLRKYGEHETQFKLPKGSTVQDLLDRLDIPEEESVTVMVNEQPKYMKYELENGDKVDFLRLKE